MNGFECKKSEKTSFITDSNGQEYFQIKLEFIRQRTISDIHFLIQMGKDENNNILYLGKGTLVEDFDTRIKEEYRLYNNDEFIFEYI